MKIEVKSPDTEYSLANLPKGWFEQPGPYKKAPSYVGKLSECGTYVVQVDDQGEVYVTVAASLANYHSMPVSPVKKITIETE